MSNIEKAKQGATTALGCVWSIIYFGMGLVAFTAIYSGMKAGVGLHWIIAFPLSILLAYIPVVGSVFGVWGAMKVWGWGFWPAFSLFFWPLAVILIAIAFSGAESFFRFFKK